MACDTSCEPSNPCNDDGCPYGVSAQLQEPVDSGPNTPASSPMSGHGPNGPPPGSGGDGGDGTVRIGVGNTSSTDINIEVTDNLVIGGRQRVHLGSGNRAAGANTGFISGNVADADDLLIGVDNFAAGGNNEVHVFNNDFKGFSSVRIGVGNYAGRSNKIVIGGPRPPGGPSLQHQPSGFGSSHYGEQYGPPSDPYHHHPAPGPIMRMYGPGPGPNTSRVLSLGRARPPQQ